MLLLSVEVGESVSIDNDIKITLIAAVSGKKGRLMIEAPRKRLILRQKLARATEMTSTCEKIPIPGVVGA